MPSVRSEPGPRTARALSLGAEVPAGAFAFRVHSVFAGAVNLRVDARRFLVTLLAADAEEYPQGIRLDTRATFDAWPLRAGDLGTCDGETLVIGGAPAAPRVALALAGATRLPRRALPALAPAQPACAASRAACAKRLEARQAAAGVPLRLGVLLRGESPASALGARLADGLRAFAGAVRAGEPQAAARAAGRVVGLGTGLTPTGDDVTCGLLAALECTSPAGSGARRFLDAFAPALAPRLDATNAIGATFLTCALAGSFGGALADLADEVARRAPGGQDGPLLGALDRLCTLGHSSGMDTATGFLFGLSLRTGAETRSHAPAL